MINPKPVSNNYSPYRAGSTIPAAIRPVPVPQEVKQHGPWKRRLLWLAVVLAAGITTFGIAEYRSARGNSIVSTNVDQSGLLTYDPNAKFSFADWSRFRQPGDGRFNILVLGIGGVSDAGQAHDGTLLTDSIQVVSVDTVNKKVGITSVPRDFYYQVAGHGPNKINSVYSFANMDASGTEQDKVRAGGEAAKVAIGKVLGTNISKFVVIDFTAAREAIDAVGGVDVVVPAALYDPAFPCADEINYCPYSISAGPHHLSGADALKYMRTRHADSDFGRAGRQQQVIGALKKKALSLGTLTNPLTLNNLITTLSSHIKTDMQPDEIRNFLSIYKDVTPENTVTNVLSTDPTQGLLSQATVPYAGYVEYPVAGYTSYGPLHVWFAKNNQDPFIGKEHASVTVASTSRTTPKQLQAFADQLTAYGFTVTAATQDASGSTTAVYSKKQQDFPVTANYLGSLTGTSVNSGAPLQSGSDFEIVYDASYTKATSK